MALFAKWLQANIGSSTTPIKSSVADTNFMGFYVENDGVGTSRGIYMRHYIGGAGASGEAGRFFTTENAAGGVGVHGVHASVSFGTSGMITGECAPVRATLQIPDRATLTGTLAALYPEIWAEGSSSSGAAATVLSFIRPVVGGDSSGASTLKGQAFLFDLTGVNAGSGATYFIDTSKTALSGYGSIKIKCPDGATRYIPVTTGS